jgi:hypothetical protein
MPRYYQLDSGGAFTNLQLYSLQMAMELWEELEDDYARDGEGAQQLKERCVFVVAALGLGLSQLLGQNNPSPRGDRVPSPSQLMDAFADEHGLERGLIDDFKRLNHFYDRSRHFGQTTTGSAHQVIDLLTFEATGDCVRTALRVWLGVLDALGKEPGSDLADFSLKVLMEEDVFYEERDEPPVPPEER